jgi:hypothetical protein
VCLNRAFLLQQYWVSREPYRHIAVRDIAERFRSWKVGKSNAEHLAKPFPKDNSHPASLVRTPYALKVVPELKALMRRELTLVQVPPPPYADAYSTELTQEWVRFGAICPEKFLGGATTGNLLNHLLCKLLAQLLYSNCCANRGLKEGKMG